MSESKTPSVRSSGSNDTPESRKGVNNLDATLGDCVAINSAVAEVHQLIECVQPDRVATRKVVIRSQGATAALLKSRVSFWCILAIPMVSTCYLIRYLHNASVRNLRNASYGGPVSPEGSENTQTLSRIDERPIEVTVESQAKGESFAVPRVARHHRVRWRRGSFSAIQQTLNRTRIADGPASSSSAVSAASGGGSLLRRAKLSWRY